MTTERVPVFSPWYRRALIAVTLAVVLVAMLAGASFRQAAIKGCEGSNDSKAAVSRVIDTLYDQSQVPSDDPEITKAREQNAVRFTKLRDSFAEILAPEDCGSLVPWDT